jgi:hypothetical protein
MNHQPSWMDELVQKSKPKVDKVTNYKQILIAKQQLQLANEVIQRVNRMEIRFLKLKIHCLENNIKVVNANTYAYFIAGLLTLEEVESFQQFPNNGDSPIEAEKNHADYFRKHQSYLAQSVIRLRTLANTRALN